MKSVKSYRKICQTHQIKNDGESGVKLLFRSVSIYFTILFLLSIILVSNVNSEEKIIAKEGDTLFKISNEYGISLKELMHKNNFNDANKIIEGEVILIPSSNTNTQEKELLTHKVKAGDTLYKIASIYNLKVKDIINLNRINDNSYLRLGQIIILPDGSSEHNQEKSFAKSKQKVNYHQISINETLLDISKIHNVPIEDIILFNQIDAKGDIDVGSKLQVREYKEDSNKALVVYGPLKVHWSKWRYLQGNYITKIKNKKEQSLFLAVNCEERRMNHTLKNGKWRNWFFPKNDFEHDLINDFCVQDINF